MKKYLLVLSIILLMSTKCWAGQADVKGEWGVDLKTAIVYWNSFDSTNPTKILYSQFWIGTLATQVSNGGICYGYSDKVDAVFNAKYKISGAHRLECKLPAEYSISDKTYYGRLFSYWNLGVSNLATPIPDIMGNTEASDFTFGTILPPPVCTTTCQ